MTEDLRAEIRSAVTSMIQANASAFADGDPGDLDRALWSDLSEAGFHLLGVPERIGGSGGTLRDLAVVIELSAFHAARLPVAEAALLAGGLLARAGLAVPAGVTLASLDEAVVDRASGRPRLTGRLRVPWGRYADHVVTVVRDAGQPAVAVMPVDSGTGWQLAENLADEPRDLLLVHDAAVLGDIVVPALGTDADFVLRRGALARSVQLAGAARAVLLSSQRYVAEREQFGRPLARFQAVQQNLATLAAEVTAMQVAADAAVLAAQQAEVSPDAGLAAEIAIASAKAVTSAGANVVASLGHQLHGALGYSKEHHLAASTTRLWSWRDEAGGEALWQDRLAAAVTVPSGWWAAATAAAAVLPA